MSAHPVTTPRWIPFVLNAAAVYNLAWGAFVVLFPLVPFRLAGMDAPNYPALVQCLGMVIGVYGIGYALAARDPVARWPLVLVGLLGKIFGPIGFVYAAANGEFPWRTGWTIVTNDLIWWLPFVAILLHAARSLDALHRERNGDGTLEEILGAAQTRRGDSLLDLSRRHDVLVVCVRHSGCTYCREALADLAQQRSSIQASGCEPVVVHMSSIADGDAMLSRYGLADVDHISDSERHVYRGLELHLGTLTELLGVKAFWRALIGGTIYRHGFGRIVGNGLQMAGMFLIRDGRIVNEFRHRSSADRPNYAEIVCPIKSPLS
jgi:peroxiredoxin